MKNNDNNANSVTSIRQNVIEDIERKIITHLNQLSQNGMIKVSNLFKEINCEIEDEMQEIIMTELLIKRIVIKEPLDLYKLSNFGKLVAIKFNKKGTHINYG